MQEHRYINLKNYKDLDNWSVENALLDFNITKWCDLVSVRELLTRNVNRIKVADGKRYKRVKIKLYNRGVVLRDIEEGIKIGTKNQYIVSSGQFIASRIDARNGAFGIVPPELEGAITTGDFWSFDINKQIVNETYLLLVLSSDKFSAFWQSNSSGTTGRKRLQENLFLNSKIPLPSLETQEMLVTKYLEKINKAKEKTKKAVELQKSINNILYDELGIQFDESEKKTTNKISLVNFKDLAFWGVEKHLGLTDFKFCKYDPIKFNIKPELVDNVFRGKSPKYEDGSGTIILNQKCNRWNDIVLEYAKSVSRKWLSTIKEENFTKQNDIIINSTGEGTIGRASMITEKYEGYLIDSHMLIVRLNKERIDPLFFTYQFNSDFIQKQISINKSAQSTKQTELGVDNLKNLSFIIPDCIDEQIRIAKKIHDINCKVSNLSLKASQLTASAKRDFEEAVFSEA